MKVVVLGCGPSGLFAAHAAAELGAEVTVLSKPRKSFMRGAQYLHRPIPGLSGKPFEVVYDLVGTPDGYRRKVYGDTSDLLVSPETLVGPAQAWDIREAYDAAWDKYNDLIRGWDAEREALPIDVVRADLVFSTIPAPLLCEKQYPGNPGRPGEHLFEVAKIWSIDMVKPSALFTYEDGGPIDNMVLCSGDESDWWYRASRIHGWENTEFPFDREPAESEHYARHVVTKPIRTNCDCKPGITRLGRYGTWTKGVLSHEAYYQVEQTLLAMAAKKELQW